jgi:cytochrome P450
MHRVAGSHTTSGTMTLLFGHLLQNEQILERVTAEMHSNLPLAGNATQMIHSINGLEQNLPYTMACIQENFRMNAVFSMPLPRKVTATNGIVIDGKVIPRNVKFASVPDSLVVSQSLLCHLSVLTKPRLNRPRSSR